MTDAAPTPSAAGSYGPSRAQPFGFARPTVAPLSVAEPARPTTTPSQGGGQPADQPDDFLPADGAVAPLESIAPAPLDARDPTVPFLADAVPIEVASWQPHQPLPLSTAVGSSSGEFGNTEPARPPGAVPDPVLSALPPPTGLPVAAAPPVAYPAPGWGGQHPAQAPAGPYPPTAGFATYPGPGPAGPYPPPMAPSSYPPPGEPATLQRALQASNSLVMTVLLLGVFFPEMSAGALFGAALIALVRSSPGRILLTSSALLAGIVGVFWWQGYFATSQWQSTTQLLSVICLVGVPLTAYQSLRR